MRLAPIPTTLAAIVVAAGVVVGGSMISAPESVTREAVERTVPVTARTLVCPAIGGLPGSSVLAAQAIPGVDSGDAGTTPLEVVALAPAADPLEEDPAGADDTADDTAGDTADEAPDVPQPVDVLGLTERGPVATTTATAEDEPTSYVLRGRDALAPGLVAEQSANATGAELHGYSSQACAAPGREQWFVGASGAVGERGRLVISNTSSSAAVVDVEVWDDAGPVDAPGTQDIGIPGGGQVVLLADALAPEAAAIALQVRADQGQVAVSLESRVSEGLDPQGLTSVPMAAAPAEVVHVPGVPGNGTRELQIVAPGDVDAIVEVRLLGGDGAFSPAEDDVVSVPAGTVTRLPLSDLAGEDDVSVELTSDEPITAAVRMQVDSADAASDLAVSAATPPLPGPAATLSGRVADGFASSLLLTGVTDQASAATVTLVSDAGTVAEELEVDIPATSTVEVPLRAAGGGSFARAVVTPRVPGTVVGTRVTQRSVEAGASVDLAPLTSPPTLVPIPEVVGQLPADLEPPAERPGSETG